VKYLCLVYGGAGQLRPASTATTVRVRDGQTLVTDGPFAETADELSGFEVFDCGDMDEAVTRARELKAAAVEVRPESLEAAP
jgi:hypothetical protein